MTDTSLPPAARKLNATEWMIVCVAALGFAFDIYELLMLPLIARPALAELLQVDQFSESGNQAILTWTGYMMWGSAISGGIFGLLGGWLTDRFGRKRVLVWSILLYALSPVAAGFSTSAEMLLVLRCTTFIGVCVEFVAAVAWLAELFPNPRQRENILGYTQAFSSVGGLLVTGAYFLCNQYGEYLPAINGSHAAWRYTLMSGMIPAIPLLILQPLLPESQVWLERKKAGTLQRASFGALFAPMHFRTAIVTAMLFACAYGAAFGAIQLTPQIVPGLVATTPKLIKLRKEYSAVKEKSAAAPDDTKLKSQAEALLKEMKPLVKAQADTVAGVNFWQEIGGLAGRFMLAFLAVRIVSRRKLLWIFQIPGLLIIPLVFAFPAAGNLGEDSLTWLKVGLFAAGFLTVAQFSFWGNYLPRVYPVHIRGLGESFAANVGGRMVGTAASPLTTALITPLFAGLSGPPSMKIAYAAAAVAGGVYLVGFLTSFWLPEPSADEDKH